MKHLKSFEDTRVLHYLLFCFFFFQFRINLRGDGLSGVGSRPVEILWDSQKVLQNQKVLPPVKRNPSLIPPDLRNKPPKVHVNYYPDTTTTRSTTQAIITTTPRQSYYITPPPRKTKPYLPKFPEYFPTKSRPNTVDFARPSYNRRNEEQISLNTEYFIKKSDFFKTTTQKSTLASSGGQTTRRKRRLTTVKPSSRIPVLVKKIAKRPILKSGGAHKKNEKNNNLCHGLLECGQSKKDVTANKNGTEKNYVVSLYLFGCDFEMY